MLQADVVQALVDAGEDALAALVSSLPPGHVGFIVNIPPERLVGYWRAFVITVMGQGQGSAELPPLSSAALHPLGTEIAAAPKPTAEQRGTVLSVLRKLTGSSELASLCTDQLLDRLYQEGFYMESTLANPKQKTMMDLGVPRALIDALSRAVPICRDGYANIRIVSEAPMAAASGLRRRGVHASADLNRAGRS